MTYLFKVNDINCAHCERRIAAALTEWGKAASFQIDIQAKTVSVESAETSEAISCIISDAGYTPKLI